MGREIRRVPLDFDAPIGETWAPLLMPRELQLPDCPECLGSGETASAKWLHSIVHLLLMLGDDTDAQQRGRHLHPYLSQLGNAPYDMQGRQFFTRRPGEDALLLTQALCGTKPDGPFGYTSSDTWRATAKLRELLDIPEGWGVCQNCEGRGEIATVAQKVAHEAWQPAEIPTGDGWQMWQTVSEGGPISPVFATAEELAVWMTENKCTVSGPFASVESAMRFIEAGWAPSFISTPEAGLVDGATYAGREQS